ncbi:hypothetical protein [Allofranklinella schreckenbergeri]|uniref:hypothetical protein n=1 Tax=Allofranklinella schreckenbergeri TaxID=1076744 RepID=UPI001EED3518|nr:hypothetical protein [Allofranklinella schreckenbergeri]
MADTGQTPPQQLLQPTNNPSKETLMNYVAIAIAAALAVLAEVQRQTRGKG